MEDHVEKWDWLTKSEENGRQLGRLILYFQLIWLRAVYSSEIGFSFLLYKHHVFTPSKELYN